MHGEDAVVAAESRVIKRSADGAGPGRQSQAERRQRRGQYRLQSEHSLFGHERTPLEKGSWWADYEGAKVPFLPCKSDAGYESQTLETALTRLLVREETAAGV